MKHEEAIRKLRMKNRKNNQIQTIPEAVAVVLPKLMLPEVVLACNSKLLNRRGKTTSETVAACNMTEQWHSEGAHKELQGQEQNVKESSKVVQLARSIRSRLKLQENRDREGFKRQTEEVLILQQNNRTLNQELEEAKYRLKRQQAEYTNERQDLSVQESEGWAEKKEIIEAVSVATDKMKKMVPLCREGLKKEEELDEVMFLCKVPGAGGLP